MKETNKALQSGSRTTCYSICYLIYCTIHSYIPCIWRFVCIPFITVNDSSSTISTELEYMSVYRLPHRKKKFEDIEIRWPRGSWYLVLLTKSISFGKFCFKFEQHAVPCGISVSEGGRLT